MGLKMMNELTRKWLDALRSGKYPQSQYALKRLSGYCCLGVACDVYDSTRWEMVPQGFKYMGIVGFLPAVVAEEFGLSNTLIDTVMTMNDASNASFAEIADYIEKELSRDE